MVGILSTWGFGLLALASLAAVAFVYSEAGFTSLITNIGQLGGYFSNLHRFTTPITDYHEFYLFWWFSWSIMIGEFVSRFVGGLKAWRLAFAMVVLPTIPLGLWFSVLYIYYEKAIVIPPWLNWFMIFVGLVFVVNSLDSLIRLYATNLGWGKDRPTTQSSSPCNSPSSAPISSRLSVSNGWGWWCSASMPWSSRLSPAGQHMSALL